MLNNMCRPGTRRPTGLRATTSSPWRGERAKTGEPDQCRTWVGGVASHADEPVCLAGPDDSSQPRWWTWAGDRVNLLLTAVPTRIAPGLVEADQLDNRSLRLRSDTTVGSLTAALRAARQAFGIDSPTSSPT